MEMATNRILSQLLYPAVARIPTEEIPESTRDDLCVLMDKLRKFAPEMDSSWIQTFDEKVFRESTSTRSGLRSYLVQIIGNAQYPGFSLVKGAFHTLSAALKDSQPTTARPEEFDKKAFAVPWTRPPPKISNPSAKVQAIGTPAANILRYANGKHRKSMSRLKQSIDLYRGGPPHG